MTFSLLWGISRSIDQANKVGYICPSIGDDHSSVGVANQDDWSVLRVNDAPGGLDVVGQRRCRVLDDADVVAVPRQDIVYILPAGAIDEASVDKNNIQSVCVSMAISFLRYASCASGIQYVCRNSLPTCQPVLAC